MGSKRLKTLMIVEDDVGFQSQLKWCFEGYNVLFASDREDAVSNLRRYEPPVILLDLGLPPDKENASEGLASIEDILKLMPSVKIIVVTGNDGRENAVKAIAKGAYDYYQKPVDAESLRMIVSRAFYLYELEEENRRLRMNSIGSVRNIVASSPQMLNVCRTIEKIAPTAVTTLLLGESGTGKEIIARALHELSDRNSGAFVAINCGAIPENLLESELFGYEKGAFTGANKQTKGKVEYAHGGTLFLDEIGDLSASLQVKLLRFLQERVIERLGGRNEIQMDVRVICATNRNLEALVSAGEFREDLYYRVNEFMISIPPLRERDGDRVLLANYILDKFAKEFGKNLRGFSEEALSAIENYEWPGNVREMENKIKRAIILTEKRVIDINALDLEGVQGQRPLNLKAVREEAERVAIIRAINTCNNNVSQTAEVLGVSRPTLYGLMNKYGLK